MIINSFQNKYHPTQ